MKSVSPICRVGVRIRIRVRVGVRARVRVRVRVRIRVRVMINGLCEGCEPHVHVIAGYIDPVNQFIHRPGVA